MDSLIKTPEDQFNIFFFFDGDMAADETVSSFDVYSGNNDDGTTSTTDVIAASSQTEQQIEVVLKGGQTAGEQHKITALVYTSLGNTFEKDIILDIIELDIGDFRKQPSEKFVIGFDFSPHMEADETLDDATIVITATNADTGADVTSTVIGTSSVDSDSTNQKVLVAVLGGDGGDFINITCQVDCDDQVLSQTKRFKRTVAMAIYDDGYYGTLEWDDDNSDDIVLQNDSAAVAIKGSQSGGPFTWSVSGTGFSMENAITSGFTNQLNADGTAEGTATITVTNAHSQDVAGYVLIPPSIPNTDFASPGSEPSGLTFDGTNLISCDHLPDKIYIHDGVSGSILSSFTSPGTGVYGLAFDGTNLISCDLETDTIYIHDGVSSSILSSFASPGASVSGLAFDGTNLISCDKGTSRIYIHDGISSSILSSFAAPATGVQGLAFDGTNLISCTPSGGGGEIYIHAGVSDSILSSFASPGQTPAGLVFDGFNLISSDLTNNRIYVHDGISEYV